MKRMKNVLGIKQGDFMRKAMVLIVIGGWLVAGGPVQAEGGEATNVSAATVNARVFNVVTYGAVGDDKTDILRNVGVTGYHSGIVVNEHTDGDNIILGSNINGLEFSAAHHASRFGRVCAQRCTHSIAVSGKHGFSIELLDIEVAGPGQTDNHNKWQARAYDINDPNNLGSADIKYWVVEGNVGAVEKFTRNGGASIQARRIGSAPAATK